MRILGKGNTAKAIKKIYPDAVCYDDSDLKNYDTYTEELTIVSPGIPPHNELVKNTKNIQSDYDLFLTPEHYSIWISGTNGKTTTTSMLYHLLKDEGFACGGNIGTALADVYKDKKLILETSSFTLHYTNKAKPNIYILLPISEDHIYWHGSFQEYEKSKLKPLTLMNENDIAIIPNKYKDLDISCKCYFYENSKDLEKYLNIESKEVEFKEPFLLDALLALFATYLVKNRVDLKKINTFIQDPHKLEEFFDKYNRVWIDDSKATNYDATLQALQTYKNKKIFLILGGDDKGADLQNLFEEMKKYDLEIFAIGSNTNKILDFSKRNQIKAYKSQTLLNAVNMISKSYENSINTSVAMLSPAAASLDQFTSYKHRGEKFKEFVKFL